MRTTTPTPTQNQFTQPLRDDVSLYDRPALPTEKPDHAPAQQTPRKIKNSQFRPQLLLGAMAIMGLIFFVGSKLWTYSPSQARAERTAKLHATVQPLQWTVKPTHTPTAIPTNTPTVIPTNTPTAIPTNTPTAIPTNTPTAIPTNTPQADYKFEIAATPPPGYALIRPLPPGFSPGWCIKMLGNAAWVGGNRYELGEDGYIYLSDEVLNQRVIVEFDWFFEFTPKECGEYAIHNSSNSRY